MSTAGTTVDRAHEEGRAPARSHGLTVRGRPVRVEHRGGHRFSARIRGHEVVMDQPRGSGGEDAGPTPTEFLTASLVACVAHYGHMFLERHGLPGSVGAEAIWWADLGAERLTRVEIRVEAPAVPPELEEGFRRALDQCLVHNSLRTPPEVVIATDGFGDAVPGSGESGF